MTDDTKRLIPPVNLLDNGPEDPEVKKTLAEFKRLTDLWRLDAGFRESYDRDPEKAIAEKGLRIEPDAFRLHIDPDEAEKYSSEDNLKIHVGEV